MRIIYHKSESTVKPLEIDTTSSKTSVYLRKNIVEKTIKTDSINADETTMYEYDEAVLTKAEYQEYLNVLAILDIRQQRADIDYLALMTGVDLEEVNVNE